MDAVRRGPKSSSCDPMAAYAFGSTALAGARPSGPKLDPTWTQVDGVELLNR
jgi:hypothetical protein